MNDVDPAAHGRVLAGDILSLRFIMRFAVSDLVRPD
jgi:hypothetical protein